MRDRRSWKSGPVPRFLLLLERFLPVARRLGSVGTDGRTGGFDGGLTGGFGGSITVGTTGLGLAGGLTGVFGGSTTGGLTGGLTTGGSTGGLTTAGSTGFTGGVTGPSGEPGSTGLLGGVSSSSSVISSSVVSSTSVSSSSTGGRVFDGLLLGSAKVNPMTSVSIPLVSPETWLASTYCSHDLVLSNLRRG